MPKNLVYVVLMLDPNNYYACLVLMVNLVMQVIIRHDDHKVIIRYDVTSYDSLFGNYVMAEIYLILDGWIKKNLGY